MLDYSKRIGCFSSSEIYKLLSVGKREMTDAEIEFHRKENPKSKKRLIEDGFGSLAMTYIKHKAWEKKAGQKLDKHLSSRPTSWGIIAEQWLHNQLSTDWILTSDHTDVHPLIPNWIGSRDAIKQVESGYCVADYKSPYSRTSYFEMYDAMLSGDIEKVVAETEYGLKYKTQLVSNAILADFTIGECNSATLIIGMPYDTQIKDIMALVDKADGPQYEYYWIEAAYNSGRIDEIPHLLEDRFYKNVMEIEFQVTQKDKDTLTDAVIKANKELLKLIEP